MHHFPSRLELEETCIIKRNKEQHTLEHTLKPDIDLFGIHIETSYI